MFAVGHFALGYLTGKGSSKATKTKLNLPLLLVASVLPDIDLILQRFNDQLFMHRGATHSIITITVLMVPFCLIYRQKSFPYYAALLSHVLIGDIPTGGIEMLWPVSQKWFGSNIMPMGSIAEVSSELILFVVATAIMFKANDLQKLFQPRTGNLFLLVAGATVLVPMLQLSLGTGTELPVALIPPSLFWLVLFAYSIIKDIDARGRKIVKINTG